MKDNKIKKVRDALGLSQEAFGQRIGLTRSAISKIESEERNLTDQTALLICREYSVNEEWLNSGYGEMFKQPTDLFELLGYKTETMDANTETFLRNFLSLSDEDMEKFVDFFKRIAGDLT